jgi:hypothetical protein
LFGTRLLIEEVNEGMAIIGMGVVLAHPGDLTYLNGAEPDDLEVEVGSSNCFDVLDNIDNYDSPGEDDYVYGPEAIAECVGEDRECRIAQMVTRSMYEACLRIPVGCDQLRVETGIVAGGTFAFESLCNGSRPWECDASPLVIDLEGDGLDLRGLEAGAEFPLMGSGPMSVGWIAGGGDDVLVGLDRDGSGCIENGTELFGEATTDSATDGFAALAQHDDDGDGVIDSADAVFSSLVAWRDDGDGACRRDEVAPLSSYGLRAIATDSDPWGERDRHGNRLGLLGRALTEGGRLVPVVDVWFRFQSRDR